MKKITLLCFALAVTFAGAHTTLAQTETSTADIDKDVALLRRDFQADKKKLIALNVPLTETEATRFWPVYDQYAAEMAKHNDVLYGLIKEYAANQKSITDAQASSIIKRWAETQVHQAQTRLKYIPLIEATIPGKKAALFFQIDRRLYALIELQVAAQIPLVTP